MGNEGTGPTEPASRERDVAVAERAATTFPRRPAEAPSVTVLMRDHLDMARPRSDAEALRILRQAFPAAPLAARVAAMADRAR
ncbi:transferase [Ancylobacter oerskovii]|nr:transferase [Ancylobacter oerskovii]